MMKNPKYVLGALILLLISVVYAQDEYLTPGCVYEMQNTYINTITCSDLDRDGIIEIIAGSNGGTIYNLIYGDCDIQWNPRWQRIDLRGEIKEIKVVDVDKDGENEVVVISDGRDHYLFVLNEDNLFEWNEDKVGAPSFSLDVADLENDGDNEIIIGTKNKKVVVLDGERDARWEADLNNLPYYVEASDLDNDGMLEVIVMDNQYLREAQIYVFDLSGKLLWKYLIDKGIYQPSRQSLAVEDINNDGMKEIIFATSKEGLGVLNNKGNILWRYPLQGVVSAVHVDDIDNDGGSDILVASPPYLYAIDGRGEMRWKALVNASMFSIKTGNLNSDPLKEIAVGTGESIQIFNYRGELLGEWILATKKETKTVEFRNICIADLDNDGVNEIVVGLNIIERRLDINYYVGELRVFEVDEEYEREVTPSETTVTTAPQTTAPITAPATTIAATAPTTSPQTTVTATSVPGEAADLTSYLPIILLIFLIIIVFVVLAAVYIHVSKRKRQETAEKPAPIEASAVDELTRLKTEEEKIEEMIKLAHVKSDKRKKDEAALEEIEEDQKKKLTETKAKIKEIEKEEKKVEEHKCGKCGRVFATERGLHVHKSRCKG